MENNGTSAATTTHKKRKGYGLAVRLIALALVVVLIIGSTNIDFSVVRYAGSESMEAANYLLEHTDFLTENRYQRLVSLLTNYNAYDISLQAAESAIGKSDYARAAKYLNRCLDMEQSEAERPELLLRLGCVYMLDEKLPEAEQAFTDSIELAPDEAEAYLLRAQVRVTSEDIKAANEDCARYIELGGDNAEMLAVAMTVAEYAEDYGTAIKAADALTARSVNDNQRAGYIAERGRFRYLEGEAEAAAEDIARAKTLDAGALEGIHFAILALEEMNAEQYAEAAEDFRRAGAKAAEDNESYYEQALVCAYLLGDHALLLEISAEAQSDEAMSARSWMLTGVSAFIQEDYTGAVAALDSCISMEPETAEANYYRGLCRMQLEDYQGASEDFTVSIGREEYTLESYYNRGLCLLVLEQYEQALTDLAFVIEDGSDQQLALAAYSLLEPLLTQ